MAAFDNWTRRVVAIPAVRRSPAFQAFLQAPLRDDWPSLIGELDLEVHDLPHESSWTEWLYYNMHLETEDGCEYGAFAAFFRTVKHYEREKDKKHWAHALNWALTDCTNKRYYPQSILDKDAPKIVKRMLEARS